jgi:hypothetical protein
MLALGVARRNQPRPPLASGATGASTAKPAISLPPFYGWFIEGFGTPVLEDAKALLVRGGLVPAISALGWRGLLRCVEIGVAAQQALSTPQPPS